MLSDATCRAILRFRRRGLTRRAIAEALGVSIGSVDTVLAGGEEGIQERARELEEKATRAAERHGGGLVWARIWRVNAQRCPNCGRNVVLPCLACEVLEVLRAGRVRPFAEVGGDGGDLAIRLRTAGERRRYEAIRARKEAAARRAEAAGLGGGDVAWFVGEHDAPAVEELGGG